MRRFFPLVASAVLVAATMTQPTLAHEPPRDQQPQAGIHRRNMSKLPRINNAKIQVVKGKEVIDEHGKRRCAFHVMLTRNPGEPIKVARQVSYDQTEPLRTCYIPVDWMAYPFNELFYVKPGDLIEVSSAGQLYQYAVSEHHLVDEVGQTLEKRLENARFMEPTDEEVIMMIACWPLTGNDKFTQRVIIRAKPMVVDQSSNQHAFEQSAWTAR